jgi:hypothetical protein
MTEDSSIHMHEQATAVSVGKNHATYNVCYVPSRHECDFYPTI